jgi:hypothetical protein
MTTVQIWLGGTNQLTESWSVSELADMDSGAVPGTHVIEHLPNPGVEARGH